MKRFLLLGLVMGLFASPASAVMYTLTEAYALTLDDIEYSDSSGLNFMSSDSPTTDNDIYNGGGLMQENVGFFGSLDDKDGDGYAWVKMGNSGDPLNLNLSGYEGYVLPIANDDQSKWDVALYLTTGTGTEYMSDWFELDPVSDYEKTLSFSGLVGLDDVDDIGFYIRGHLIGPGVAGYPSDPDAYHISVVPLPAGVILGLLGLGVVGLKLRRFA